MGAGNRPDPAHPPATRGTTEDGLRGVFTALARRGPGEQAVVQLVVTTHRRAPLARGATHLLGGVLRAVVDLVELLLPAAITHRAALGRARRVPTDPAQAAAVKAVDTKRATGPHLRATLRVAVTAVGVRGPARHRRVRRRLVIDVVAGYDLAATVTRLRAAVVGGTRAARGPRGLRWVRATLPELAALWHLPAEPSRYGMPEITARTRPAGWRLPRIPTATPPKTGHNGTSDSGTGADEAGADGAST